MTALALPASIALVFPHQLFQPHPAVERSRPVVLVEDSLFFGDKHAPARFHLHKLLLHRATMRAYADELRRAGHRVDTVPYDPHTTCVDTIERLAQCGVQEVHLADPVDYLLDRRLRRAARTTGIRLIVYDTPMFLTPRADIDTLLGTRPFMARFYTAQRRRLDILMDGDKPRGGRWSYDAENRKRLPRNAQVPAIGKHISPHVRAEDIDWVQRNFRGHPGSTSSFWHPVTRAEAEQRLDEFLTQRFAAFGDYEDAISSRHDVVFHSVITPALNIGLLTPRRVVDRALAHADEHGIPLNSLEGFIRQVIGWREFIRAVYVRDGVAMRNSNFWNHTRPLPRSFYDGSTGLDPVDLVVRRVEKLAWCHHIERLMVLSNAMTLMGIAPHDVYRWFMEMFVDAYDWVMVPNVYGMGLFADGGTFATKPYISGSNYLLKMSDIPRGDWCRTWDGLFWSFIDRHRDFFSRQHRLSMMVRTLDRMPEGKRREHLSTAQVFLGVKAPGPHSVSAC